MDEKYMKMALDLAEKGRGKTSPNPLVGAVIVKNGEIIASGYHEKYGENHAEINAIENATQEIAESTMYVTLEPCSHYGKTKPCVDKIIEKKIKKVVIGMIDPNPIVAGRGIEKLKAAGVQVREGVLESKCKIQNEIFIKYITEKKPFVLLKTAMSLDGKIATRTGKSKWITGDEARRKVHALRNELSAIMVGVNTVIKDDPQLTCRIHGGRNPIRIIVDSHLRISEEFKVLKEANEIKTIIATTANAPKVKKEVLEGMGIKIITANDKDGKVSLEDLMTRLGAESIDSILLEGGGQLNYSALREGIVDKINAYIAPIIIGGENAKTPVEGQGVEDINEALIIKGLSSCHVGKDIFIEGYVERREQPCLQE